MTDQIKLGAGIVNNFLLGVNQVNKIYLGASLVFGALFNLLYYTYSGVFKSVSAQGGQPQGLRISTDGTRMFTVDHIANNVFQYSLSTPFDLSTAVYSGTSFSIGTQATVAISLEFSNDGSKMYVGDNTTSAIYEYDLPTPWSLTGASYSGNSKIVLTEALSPRGVRFKDDGTKMYVLQGGGVGDNEIYEYDLSTAFNVSTAVYNSVTISLGFTVGEAQDLVIDPEGRYIYVVSQESQDPNIFQLEMSTPWDLSTASLIHDFDANTIDTAQTGIDFSVDGLEFYTVGGQFDRMYQFNFTG